MTEATLVAVCRAHGFEADHLNEAIQAAAELARLGLCQVEAGRITVPEPARLLLRLTAACWGGANWTT